MRDEGQTLPVQRFRGDTHTQSFLNWVGLLGLAGSRGSVSDL